jgi:hypothetical protein
VNRAKGHTPATASVTPHHPAGLTERRQQCPSPRRYPADRPGRRLWTRRPGARFAHSLHVAYTAPSPAPAGLLDSGLRRCRRTGIAGGRGHISAQTRSRPHLIALANGRARDPGRGWCSQGATVRNGGWRQMTVSKVGYSSLGERRTRGGGPQPGASVQSYDVASGPGAP